MNPFLIAITYSVSMQIMSLTENSNIFQNKKKTWEEWHSFTFIYLFIYFCLFAFSRAALVAHGDSQARGLIGAVATGLHQSHSNMGSELRLHPIPQLMAMPDP